MTTPRNAPRWPLTVAAVAGALFAGFWMWETRLRLDRIEEQTGAIHNLAKELERLEQGVQLLRAEYRAEAVGIQAILDGMEFWAPQLNHAATPASQLVEIQNRINGLLRGAKALGPEAAAPLTKAFLAARSGEQDELRKWILKALVQADPVAGKEMLVKLVRGLEIKISTRIREFATDRLMQLDPVMAGSLLRDILHYESSKGVDPERIPQDYRTQFPEAVYAHGGHYPGFFNLVARYGESNDPQRIPTLIMLLGRHVHDLGTIQEAVKLLGKLKAVEAVLEIKRVYHQPPGIADNPIFKNHCLEALDRIQGSDALEFFREQQRVQSNPIVAEKLKALLMKYGG